MIITVEKVLTPDGWRQKQTLEVSDGKIARIRDAHREELAHLLSGALIPGYVDTQVNGGGGVLLNQKPTSEGVKIMARAHLAFGSTSMLPTVITDNADIMWQAADAVADVLIGDPLSVTGIHFEGPFLSTAKKGVHDEQFIRAPGDRELSVLFRRDIGTVLVTLAPEQVDTGFIRELVSEGVRVALGHTNATSEQVFAALSAGATGFTHLYNAMSPLTSREPGVVGAALLDETSYCGLIVDHHHVHPDSAKLAIRMKGTGHIMLVTDAMAHVGTDLSSLPFFSTEIRRQGDKLTTPEGTLAGSCLNMHTAVLNTHHDLGFSLAQSSSMASDSPARFLGLEHKIGRLEVGKDANMLLLDSDQQLKQVWLRGQIMPNIG